MKKSVSLLLLACMCLSASVLFASCDELLHEHTYKAEWESDGTHHWHACEVENCPEAAEKAEHVWDEGKVNKKPSKKEKGKQTVTCKVCQATKENEMAFKGLDQEQWDAMRATPNFENYTLTQSGKISYMGGLLPVQEDCIIKFNSDKVHLQMKADGQTVVDTVYTGEEAAAQKQSYEKVFLALLEKLENFQYDETEQVYRNAEPITVSFDMAIYQMSATVVMKNGTIAFSDDGKLVSFTCEYTQTTHTPQGTMVSTTQMNWGFSDYGSTVIEAGE